MLSFHETSIRKLKIFCTVVEAGGFAAAQSILNTSAATISVQMKELEAQLGMTLCQRGRSGFRITGQGEAVYEAAQGIFSSFSNFNLAVGGIRNRLAGEIKIGLQANLATNPACRLDDVMRRFHHNENAVTFRFDESRSADQEVRTLEGRYDLSIGIFPNRVPGLEYTPLFSEKIELYCSKDHVLGGLDDATTLAELSNHAVVSSGGAPDLAVPSLGKIAPPTATTENMDASILLILSGCYIGFLPTHFAAAWEERGLIRPLLSGRLATSLDFCLITRKGGRDNMVVDVFLADLLAVHRSECPLAGRAGR